MTHQQLIDTIQTYHPDANTDLLARLLETANRSGRYADAKVYGRGLMDLAAATAPIPPAKAAIGSTLIPNTTSGTPVRSTIVAASPAPDATPIR